MIKMTILYPHDENQDFDLYYYQNKHMPLIQELVGEALLDFSIEKGIGGALPGDPPPFRIVTSMHFESLESMQEHFSPHASKIVADVANFTTLSPQVLIAKVLE